MKLLMSDTALPEGLPIKEGYEYVDLSEKRIAGCLGCFGCWVKTPGKCVIRDDAVSIYPLIAESESVIYVTRLYCGNYDVVMKTMLERALPIQQAFLRLHHGETHHVQRSVREKSAVVIAYGDIAEAEKEIFQELVARNAHNMLFSKWKIHFVSEKERDETIVKEVAAWES